MLHSSSLTICSTVLFFHWIHIRKFLLWLILCPRPPAGPNSTFRKLPERCSIYIEANKIVLLPFIIFLCNQPTSDLLHPFYIKRSILSISTEPHYQPQPSTRMCMLTSSEQNHRKTGLAANQPALHIFVFWAMIFYHPFRAQTHSFCGLVPEAMALRAGELYPRPCTHDAPDHHIPHIVGDNLRD